MEEPWLLRVEEAARLLGLGRSKVYELVRSGEIPSITIGRSRRVPVNELRRWTEERMGLDGRIDLEMIHSRG